MSEPAVSAVIVNYESGDALSACLGALSRQDVAHEVVIVDNGSTDDGVARAANAFPGARVVRPGRNLGFAAGANLGAASARGGVLLFLNPDVTLADGCLAALAGALGRGPAGVVGPAIEVSASDSLEYGATIDPFGYPVALIEPRPPLYVPGCALATRAEVFRGLGGFDERFFMFAEDVDYCWRVLLAGWDVAVVPEALALHAGGASAPGGYLSDDGLATTRFRVALRERNTLAMLLKCAGPGALAATALAYPVQALATAVALVVAGKPATARAVAEGLAWNARELPETLSRRRAARRRGGRDRLVRGRMYRGVRKLELLAGQGFPRVDERPTPRAGTP